jgi:hypothetical protein
MPYGQFESDFDLKGFDWEGQVLWKLKEMESNVQDQNQKYARQRAATQHRSYLLDFLGNSGIASSRISHTTCLFCLMELPEHTMPCGHVICTACAQDFGRVEDGSTLIIDSCPLHNDQQWTGSRILTTLNPPFAGTRILSLDGLVYNIGSYRIRADNVDRGGMKGIVELLVLKAIESELRSGLQVQHFFDLIVGTRFVISCFGAALCFG